MPQSCGHLPLPPSRCLFCPVLSSGCSFAIIVIICPVFKRFNVGFLAALLYVSVVPSGNSLGNITAAFTATQVECLVVPCSVSFSLLFFLFAFYSASSHSLPLLSWMLPRHLLGIFGLLARRTWVAFADSKSSKWMQLKLSNHTDRQTALLHINAILQLI